MAQPMSSHEEISTGLLRGLGHSMLTMIVLMPWLLSLVGGLFFKDHGGDFGGAGCSSSFSHSSHYLFVYT